MNLRGKSITSIIIYIILMGLGMYTMHHIFKYSYGEPEMVFVLLYFEIALMFLALFSFSKYICPVKNNWKWIWAKKNILTVIPFVVIACYLLFSFVIGFSQNVEYMTSKDHVLLSMILVTTILVGISEEVMFRGVGLFGLSSSENPIKISLISAVLFSLMHSVNILGGSSFTIVMMQLVMTFIFGLAAAFITLQINTLIPLIIYHIIWDFTLISSSVIKLTISPLVLIISTVLEISVIIYFLNLHYKK